MGRPVYIARRFVVVLRWTNYFPDTSSLPNLLRPKIFFPYLYIVIKAIYWSTDHTIPDKRPDLGIWQFIWWFYDYSFSKSVRGAFYKILISTTTLKIKQTLLQYLRWKSCNELFSSIVISPLSLVLLYLCNLRNSWVMLMNLVSIMYGCGISHTGMTGRPPLQQTPSL